MIVCLYGVGILWAIRLCSWCQRLGSFAADRAQDRVEELNLESVSYNGMSISWKQMTHTHILRSNCDLVDPMLPSMVRG